MSNNFIHIKGTSFSLNHIVRIDWKFLVDNPVAKDNVVCIDTTTCAENIYLYYNDENDYSAIQRLKELTGYPFELKNDELN